MKLFISIRASYATKVIVSFIAFNLIFGVLFPMRSFALPEGPTQPEFNNFTPIGVSDMVDLSSGDFNYSIPLLDVGGYPLSLGYSSSTNFDEASSWVGHGWDLSAGQINRSMRVIPDDYDGTDEIITEDSRKPDITYALGSSVIASIIGFDNATEGTSTASSSSSTPGTSSSSTPGTSSSSTTENTNVSFNGRFGLVATYNNYTGFSITPSLGVSALVHDKLNNKESTGSIDLTPSSTDGVSINTKFAFDGGKTNYGAGLTYNSFDKKLSLNTSISSNESPKKEENSSFGGSLNFNGPTSFVSDYGLGYQNISGKFNVASGMTFWGLHLKGEFYVNYAEQRLKKEYNNRKVAAYGYNHSNAGIDDGMKDYTKSNSRTFNQNTATLSVPQNMYDMYSISGQGLQGSFKPQNSQVGYHYEPKVRNTSGSVNLGAELAGGNLVHGGGNIEATHSNSNSGYWNSSSGNRAQGMLSKQIVGTGDKPNYQDNYFKMIGENSVKNPIDGTTGYVNKIGNKDVLQLRIERTNFNPNSLNSESLTKISPNYFTVSNSGAASPIGTAGAKLIQNERIPTAKTISPTSIDEVLTYNTKLTSGVTVDQYSHLNKIEIAASSQLKNHHQAGFKIVDESGTTYNYTQPLENKTSQNVSFSVSNSRFTQDKSQVSYSLKEASTNNKSGTDHYFSKKTIPSYTHTSLLKSILSSDYQDKGSNGPSPDDLGSYTIFKYTTPKSVKYRFPVQSFEASYSEGFKSLNGDDKANFSYGEKEVSYLERIITKTHVAVFKLNVDTTPIGKRKDNLTAKDVNNGVDENGHTRYLDKIYLYTLKQAEDLGLLDQNIPINFENLPGSKPLKVVHFEYDYSIQSENGGLPNSAVVASGNGRAGKLTLKSVYFTYGSSAMGKLTPYSFQYNQDVNFKYHNLNKDVWGNYKPNVASTLTVSNNLEFPYTNQDESVNTLGLKPADIDISKFLLSKIKLPSGGIISVNYEADDYAFVQDKRAMQLVDIKGFGDNPIYSATAPNLDLCYTHAGPRKYVYLKVDKNLIEPTNKVGTFKKNFLEGIENEPIFFKILANISPKNTAVFNEYITGYTYLTKLDSIATENFVGVGDHYIVPIELAMPKLNGGSGSSVHPFAKATWNYSKQYLSEVAFVGSDSSLEGLSPIQAVKRLGKDLSKLIRLFRGPNKTLRGLNCGRQINLNKSFIRLLDANKIKLGGGARVKSVLIDSNWDSMLNNNTTASSSTETLYGQEYSYKDATGIYSSGVASFEPPNSEENPLMLPFEDNNNLPNNDGNTRRLIDKFLAPVNSNYVVGPLMKDYYPNPQITYSRVTVKNIKPVHPTNPSKQIVDKATGYVVNDFYTHKDFPTIEKQTPIDINFTASSTVKDFIAGMIGFPATAYSSKKLIATQGFYVETNDMNGKPKSQTVYAEGASGDNFITKTEYNYQIDENGKLDNVITLVDQFGKVTREEIGVEYDVVNDFAKSASTTINAGADFNGGGFFVFIGVLPHGTVIPSLAYQETQTRIATTAKHVHRGGILKSTTVYDKGSSITTENLAYDYLSRMPILKRVNNEFGDVIYNMDFPAYWVHQEMANSSFNTDMKFNTGTVTNNKYSFTPGIIDSSTGMQYLVNGDVVQETVTGDIFWVTNVDTSTNTYELIDVNGFNVNLNKQVKIVKSGYDNKPGQSISSISLSENPIQITANGLTLRTINESFKIFNASAIELKEEWLATCECGYDELPTLNGNGVFNDPNKTINPYVNNLKGQYRPVKSWAYLSGRTTTSSSTTQPRLRNDGFYKDYSPFYTLVDHDNNNVTPNRWIKSTNLENTKWQYASEVSKISPYGLELENKDPLDIPRFSAATYGFNKKFPSAVASNTEYRELAFDGFEDYDYIEHPTEEHFDFTNMWSQSPDGTNPYKDKQQIDYINAVTSSTAHSGRKSIKVSNGALGITKALKPCGTDSNEALARVMNHLYNLIPANNSTNPSQYLYVQSMTNLSNIDGWDELYASIYQDSSTGLPGIYNLFINEHHLSFNFYENNDSSDPGISNPSNYLSSSGNNVYNKDVYCSYIFPRFHSNSHYLSFTPVRITDLSIYGQIIDPLIQQVYGMEFQYNDTNGNTVVVPPLEDVFVRYILPSQEFDCTDCGSFSPIGTKTYVLSSWVKVEKQNSNPSTPTALKEAYPTTYENVSAIVQFSNEYGQFDLPNGTVKLAPSGKIINGWQKITGKFTVDNRALKIKFILENKNSQDAFFDDIRIHPVNGSMKSFVYDDKTFRLAAELDDNNYATFYEYDLEGNLIRIKKETERGIMTIQESRQGMSKPTPLN